MTLKEWAEKFNNMEYGSTDIADANDELSKEGIVAVIGASDDLCEFYGALYEEFDCYNGENLYWNGTDFFTNGRKERFLDYVDNEYPEFFDICYKMFNENTYYIKISDGEDCQFVYDTNIPCEKFKVMEDGELYCEGLLFYIKDLKV